MFFCKLPYFGNSGWQALANTDKRTNKEVVLWLRFKRGFSKCKVALIRKAAREEDKQKEGGRKEEVAMRP